MGAKTEKDFLPKVSREKRGTVSNEVSRERSENCLSQRPRTSVKDNC